MASRTVVADSVDPLSGLNGPLFFRRTIKASADDGSLPANSSDLESIHNVMKSLELRSQENQMNEAKRIVNDRGELLESGLDGILTNADTTDAIAAKVKGKPQERRPGLTRARKKGPFSLRTSSSQPSVSSAPTLNFDQLQDPDELFDAYERIENAKREVLKQQGGNMENLNQNNPSTRTRRQRPGILGKTYNKKHLYSLAPPEDHDMSIFTQEKVEQGIRSADKDEVGDKLVDLDPKSDVDVDEIELAVSAKKAENDVTSILDHLLSGNDEELDGEGALNLLQDRLKIKPLDLGRFSMLSAGDSFLKARTSSLIIDSSLKNVKNKSPVVDKQVASNPVNLVSSPTPPRSPFASLFLLKKRILQSNPLRDPFSPLNRYYESHNALIVQPVDKQQEQANAGENLSASAESNPRVEDEITEHTCSMAAQKVFESEGSLHDQLVDDTMNIEQYDAQKVAEGEDSLFDQLEDGNVSIVRGDADNTPNNIPDYNTEEITKLENQDPNHSVTQDNAMDDPSTRAVEQPTVFTSLVNQADLQRARKEAGKKRIRNAHPLRKSIAEAGTSFENGIRRSKRIKMRPLQYWKGERPLYGRINDSLKLIGIKCISPGKSDTGLKVKPYISSELYEYKDLLDMAARH